MGSKQLQVNDPKRFHPNAARPCRHRRGHRPPRPAEEGRRQLRRLLPVPQREITVVHGQPDQAVLPLLRLRRPRHRDRLPHGIRREVVPRRRRGPRPRGRAGRPAPGAPRGGAAARGDAGSRRAAADRRPVLPRAAQGRAAGDRIPEGPRADRRHRRPLRHRLRAGRLAAAGRRVSPLRGAGAGNRRPGDRRRRRQALRPLSRPDHVPDPRRPRPGDRLRRARAGAGRAQVPQFAGDPAVLQGPRALRPVSRPQRHPRCRPGASSSKATWTSSRSRSTASITPSPRSAPRPRPRTCTSCSG